MDVFFTDCQQVWSQHKLQIRSDTLMEAKQEALLVAQPRWRRGGKAQKAEDNEGGGERRKEFVKREIQFFHRKSVRLVVLHLESYMT